VGRERESDEMLVRHREGGNSAEPCEDMGGGRRGERQADCGKKKFQNSGDCNFSGWMSPRMTSGVPSSGKQLELVIERAVFSEVIQVSVRAKKWREWRAA